MFVERVMRPNRHNMENYGDLQPITLSMKGTLWVPGKTFLLAFSLRTMTMGSFVPELLRHRVFKRC